MSEAPSGRSGSLADGPLDDDLVIAFRTDKSSARGRVIRLGQAVDRILSSHDYPEPVSRVLGEALALTAMLGTQLKFDGRLILQTNTDGPLRLLVVNYQTNGSFRGYASFDEAAVRAQMEQRSGASGEGDLLGKGYMALTIDPGAEMERYQGIVELGGGSLSSAAQEYFHRSEQIASFIKLSVARVFAGGSWRWRAGGLMVQHLTAEGGMADPQRAPADEAAVEDDWRRVEMLARTVEDHELTDPTLSPERLLYRLFHEEGVRAAPGLPIEARCGCTREHVGSFLRRFGTEELSDLKEANGDVTVTCEFCSTPYRFTDADLG